MICVASPHMAFQKGTRGPHFYPYFADQKNKGLWNTEGRIREQKDQAPKAQFRSPCCLIMHQPVPPRFGTQILSRHELKARMSLPLCMYTHNSVCFSHNISAGSKPCGAGRMSCGEVRAFPILLSPPPTPPTAL